MQIKTEERDGVLICSMEGDIDINTSPQIKKEFDNNILRDKKTKLLINFKNVNYVDSSGLATMVDLLKKVRNYGGKMRLAEMSEKVKNLFAITKLDKLFDIDLTQEESSEFLRKE